MAEIFQDFVPEGADAGALSEGGFQDFVPAREPVKQVVEETVSEEIAPEAKAPVKKIRK